LSSPFTILAYQVPCGRLIFFPFPFGGAAGLWGTLVLKKICVPIKKKFFDSSALKPLGLYGNLLGLFVAYS
jgi:hypothetical protein